MIINDLKFALRMMKYGYELEKYIKMSILILALGIACSLSGEQMLGVCGAFMMMTAPVMLFQSYMGVSFLRVVQSSPKAKYLQTNVMASVLITLELIGYTFATLCLLIMAAMGAIPFAGIGLMCLMMTLFALLTMVFYVVFYRFFIASSICFYFGFIVLFGAIGEENLAKFASLQIPWYITSFAGLFVIALFWYVIRFLAGKMVRFPLDTRALGAAGKTMMS